MGKWLTPSSLPTATAMVAVFIPADIEWWYPLAGALMDLGSPNQWEQVDPSNLTPQETASAYDQMWLKLTRGENMHIGTIIPYPSDTLPPGWLLCDGSQVLQASYPRLYEIVGATFGSADAGYFRLPNLQNRFIAGAGDDYSIADTGGQNTHTLTVNEMPSHDHSEHEHAPSVLVVFPGEGVAAGADPLIETTTGSRGGGEAHENRPPYMALNWCIVGDWPS